MCICLLVYFHEDIRGQMLTERNISVRVSERLLIECHSGCYMRLAVLVQKTFASVSAI